MSRRLLLELLPKIALSRLTGAVTRVPLPRALRPRAYRAFARRYGADLTEAGAPLEAFRSLADFFGRPLRSGSRPVADAPVVWPCDGRIVTCGPLDGERIPQVKGVDYGLAELLGDPRAAARFAGGTQATIYLAPGDYHRVHAPFDGELRAVGAIRGTLFPVNPPAVACIPRLFVRNARRVFDFALPDGRAGAVVMVGALNVGSILVSAASGTRLARGDELGRFAFGSTTIVLLDGSGPGFAELAAETRVRTGAAAAEST